MRTGIAPRFPGIKPAIPFADHLKEMRTILLIGALLLIPGTARAGDIELVENNTQWAIDKAMAVDIYKRIVRQMERTGLPVKVTPYIGIHCINRKEDNRVLNDCLQGGCGHMLIVRSSNKKKSRLAFIAISDNGIQIWLSKPDGVLMALAITISLNYENRLRLEPPAFTEIAATAWRSHMLNQKWKVSAENLKHGR